MPFYAPTGAWITYTPTVTTTGATIGNAAVSGAYIQFGKTISFWAKFAVGSTTNFTGLSNIICTLPFSLSTSFDSVNTVFGSGGCEITGVYYGLAMLRHSTTAIRPIGYITTTNGKFQDITATFPASWGVGDTWFISGTYESA